MLLKRLLFPVLLAFGLTAYAQENAVDKQQFCSTVGVNVISGSEAKRLMSPKDLEEKLAVYAKHLSGLNKFNNMQIQQLVRAVEVGYYTTKDPDVVAQKLFELCMNQKET